MASPARGLRDHLAAAATLYEEVRRGFQDACTHERRRVHVLQSVLRAAGRRPLANGPVAKWRATWAGFCEDDPRAPQRLLPVQPPAAIVTALHRGAPRPEVAPPAQVAQWPATTRHVFVEGWAGDGNAPAAGWGVVAVDATAGGIDGWQQVVPAPPVASLSGTTRLDDSRVDAASPTRAAGLHALLAALRYMAGPTCPSDRPVLLHVQDAASARMAVGVWNPEGGRELVAQARLDLRRLQRGGMQVWIVCGVAATGGVWQERARALALTGAGVYGHDDSDDSCPVCFEDYEDRLPGTAGVTRALAGRFACGHWKHSMCRECLADLHARPAPLRCPFCRAQAVP